MENISKKEQECIDELIHGNCVSYCEKKSGIEYFIIPKQNLKNTYGNYFIQHNLLLNDDDWPDEVIDALVKEKAIYEHIQHSNDYDQDETFYDHILKVSSCEILPTIAKASGKSCIHVAAEEFSLDGNTYYKINVVSTSAYAFPYIYKN